MARKFTQAKKEANERYLETQSRFLVTMPQERFERFTAYINALGQSRNSFILEAIDEKISRK